jgi:hypothetical protein
VARGTSAEGSRRSQDVEYEMDAVSRVGPIRRSTKVDKGQGSARSLRNVEKCRVPEETVAIKELAMPTT